MHLNLKFFDTTEGQKLINEYGAKGLGIFVQTNKILANVGESVEGDTLVHTVARRLGEDTDMVNEIIELCVQNDLLVSIEHDEKENEVVNKDEFDQKNK